MEVSITQDLVDALTTPGPQTESLLRSLPVDLLYKIVIEYLPSKTIVRLCQVSRYFKETLCGEEYLWHHLYEQDISSLRMPLIPEGQIEPNWHEEYLRIINASKNLRPNDLLKFASEHGYEKLFELALSQGATDYVTALTLAIQGGYRDIVSRLITADPQIKNRALSIAAGSGHIGLVDDLIASGATDLDNAFLSAVKHDQLEMVEHLRSKGILSDTVLLTRAIYDATKAGHVEMVKYLIALRDIAYSKNTGTYIPSPTIYDSPLVYATEYNHPDIVDFLITRGADIRLALVEAVRQNNLELVNHLISLGANRDDAFISAARFGKRDIMDYFLPLVTMGVLDSALDTAIRHSNHEIVEYLKSLGAKEGV